MNSKRNEHLAVELAASLFFWAIALAITIHRAKGYISGKLGSVLKDVAGSARGN